MKRSSLRALLLAVFAAACLTTAAAAESTISTAASLDLADGSIVITEEDDVTVFTQGDTVIRTTAGSGIIRQTDSGTTSTANSVSVESGTVALTISDLWVSSSGSPISVAKDAALTLTLVGESTLSAGNGYAGIEVPEGAALAITGTGSVSTRGGSNAAGIGGSYSDRNCGHITINGGSVTATGSTSGAGIGGGNYGSGGIVTIDGGAVTAIGPGSYGGAGIGSGCYGNSAGTITINGGLVTATGVGGGAGIGGGYYCDTGGTITINGGTVTATSQNGGGAGIGGGSNGHGGTIVITDGTVIAVNSGGLGAAIGGGYGYGGSTITISGGAVTATAGAGAAGIGGGYKGNGGTITISGGTVTATGGDGGSNYNGGSGIGGGGGYGRYDTPGNGGIVFISNAEVAASGFYHAIGGGAPDNQYGCDAITIEDSATVDLSFSEEDGAECQEKITIRTQPQSSAALIGNRAKFTVDAYGHSGLSYQWMECGVAMEGQTSSVCFSSPLNEETEEYYYYCQLTNRWGDRVTTYSATPYILAFTQQPTDVDAGLNDIASLAVTASCENVTYQWQRSYDGGVTWRNVTGETFRTLMVNATLSENDALYRCVITATNGDSLASDSARITVESDATTYTTEYYLQDAAGKGYTLADRVVTEGTAGSTAAAPEKTFEHFTENPALGTASGTVLADNSLTLSRYYDRNSYSISFEMNGGAAEADITALYEAEVTAPPNPTRAGYAFAGWYADEELTEEYEFSTMPGENITVYAGWTVIGEGRGTEYKITGISLLDGDYNPISGIPADRFYVEVSVRNLSSSTMDTLSLATYDADGRFLGMQFLRSNPPVGYTFVLGTTLDNRSGEIAKIKAFMLPVLGGVVPLAEAVEYTD